VRTIRQIVIAKPHASSSVISPPQVFSIFNTVDIFATQRIQT
jgi:hypothetical protein